MKRMITENGFGSFSHVERFVLVAYVDVISNSITPTNPPKVSKQISITFIVGDVFENRTFSSCSVTFNGIGLNDNKAFISAFSRLNPSNKEIQTMMNKVQNEIAAYYGTNTSKFRANAKQKAMSGDWNGAIAYLMSIPPINDASFNSCQDYAMELYIQKINQEGNSLFISAKAIWTTDKNQTGAEQAIEYLKKINPQAKIYEESMILWKEINEKMKSNEKEAKAFALKQYEDQKKIEMQRYKDSQVIKLSIIEACKSVGIAYAQNRPSVVTKIVNNWF